MQMRYFHNFYGQFQLTSKVSLIVGFDIGAEQKTKGSTSYNTWYSPVLIAKYALTAKKSIAARGEYYNDAQGVIISTNTPNGFQTYGYSLNFDYQITENSMWRIECRGLESKDNLFLLNEKPSKRNYFVVTSLAVAF